MNSALQFTNRGLFFLVASLALFLVLAALGPGLWGTTPVPAMSWQHQMFEWVCHQDPLRSYRLQGSVMAVCSRCIGIYTSFLIAWILMPLIAYTFKLKKHTLLWLFGTAIVLNLTDVAGNLFGFWANTNGSRFIFGVFWGATTALLLINDFFNQQQEESDGKFRK